jgi:hypothetical protein
MDDPGFYSIIDDTVDDPEAQRELVAAFAEIQERRVRFYPGYRSARFLASVPRVRAGLGYRPADGRDPDGPGRDVRRG